MGRTIEILKQYGKADSYERRCLFLQFPDLRDVFQDVESQNPTIEENCSIFD
jgi:hypothetical protein